MRTYLPATRDAVATIGAEVAAARKGLGWTQDELASRLGTSRQLVARIERGSEQVAIGSVLEAALLVGVPLFGVDRSQVSLVADRARAQAALLPARVRRAPVAISDDF